MIRYKSETTIDYCRQLNQKNRVSQPLIISSYPISDQLNFIRRKFIHLRNYLVSHKQYLPQHHFMHLAQTANQQLNHSNQQVGIDKLFTILPQIPDKFQNLKKNLYTEYLPRCLNILNNRLTFNQTDLGLKKYTTKLSYEGYLNLIKQLINVRQTLPSQHHKTFNYHLTFDKQLYSNNEWKYKRIKAKMNKFDDIVGFMLFLQCLAYIQFYSNQGQIKNSQYFPNEIGHRSQYLNNPIITHKQQMNKWKRPKIFKSHTKKQINSFTNLNIEKSQKYPYTNIFDNKHQLTALYKFLNTKQTIQMSENQSSNNLSSAFQYQQLIAPNNHQNYLRNKWFPNKYSQKKIINNKVKTQY